ncbi:DUF262 domain-containing protein [Microbacterium sp. NPDC090014]|uniref:GmrSD restriction endonuclease domain-containing protein n=1 Tax=Microbacterium sp. NPDC090014 TaxID=3364205 RepID=UPI0037FD5C40
MKPDKVNPREVFYQPSRLVVPLFQRPYVWSKERQWEPLWQDIVRLTEVLATKNPTATHFLGAFVVQQLPLTLGTMQEWSVIDGQQRLTTLQILLDALHAQLMAKGQPTLAAQVEPLIENPAAFCQKPEDRFKVWPTNHDRAGFEAVMSAVSPVDYGTAVASRLSEAHRFFSDSIATWLGCDHDVDLKAKLLVDAITGQLEIVSIRLDLNEDAQAIFETLNARGEPLSAADLIKNFVFQNYVGSDGHVEAAYTTNWAELETPWWVTLVTAGRVTHPRASWFLWHWLRARLLADFPIRELFTEFKAYVTGYIADGTGALGTLLPEIKRAADKYRAVMEGSQTPSGVLAPDELFSYRVGTLDSEVVRPLLIWLDEKGQVDIPAVDRRRILELLESWFVRRAIVKAPSQGANRLIIELMVHLSRLPHDRLADATEAYLASNNTTVGYWPDDDEVAAALLDAPAYNKYLRARLRMILEALEDDKRGYPTGKQYAMSPITRATGTVEHLMPQKWRANWPADLTPEQETVRDRKVHELGNLTLVTGKLNTKVSNGSWASKVTNFHEINDVLLTNEALSMAGFDWNESAITRRTSSLIAAIQRIWPVPAGHVGLPTTQRSAVASVSVDVAQLVSDGLIEAGAVLRARSAALADVEAAVGLDGRIFVKDTPYDTPSGAAKAISVAGGLTGYINGWTFWEVVLTGKSLANIRTEYLERLGEDTPENDPVEQSPAMFVEAPGPGREQGIAAWAPAGVEDA